MQDVVGLLGFGAFVMFMAATEARGSSARITYVVAGLLLTAGAIALYLLDKGKL